MAYKRYARKHRRNVRRSRLAGKVRRLAKVVSRTKPTRKVYEDSVLMYASYSGNQDQGTVACVSSFTPATGTGFSNRQNPIVHLNRINMTARFNTTDTNAVVRLQGFILTDSFELGVTVNNLFNPSTGSSNAPIGQVQPSNLCNQRYRMIYDSGPRCMGTSGGLHPNMVLRAHINLKGLKVDFGGVTSGNPVQNLIYWVAWSDDAPGVGPTYITNTLCGITWQHHYSG